MADFTDRLPLTDGTNRVIDDPASPSIVTPILQTLSGGLESYVQYRQGVIADREKAKKDEEKRRAADAASGVVSAVYGAQDQVANQAAAGATAQRTVDSYLAETDLVNQTANAPIKTYEINETTGQVFDSQPLEINPTVQKQTEKAVGDISNFVAAVDQGRMPPISLKSAINGRIRKLFETYPDQAENILDILEKTGVKDVVFAEIGDLVSEIKGERTRAENQLEDDRQFEQKAYEAGAAGLGELMNIGGANGGPMSRQEVVAAGLRYMRMNTELELTERQGRITAQNAALTAEQRKETEETTQQEIVRVMSGQIWNDAAPLIQMSQQIAAGLAADPTGAFASRWEQLGVMANGAVNNWVESAVQIAVQKGYKGDVNSLRSNFHAQFKGLLENFTGEKSVAAANGRALSVMQDKLGINLNQALPVFMSLKRAGLKVDEMHSVMEGIQNNPELAKKLGDEIRGFVPEFGQERASVRLMNIIKIMRGEATLAYMDPTAAKKQLPILVTASNRLAKDYNRGLSVGSDALLNTVGEVSIATRTLTPSSGYGAHYTAAMALSNTDTRAALIKAAKDPNADKKMVFATIQAVRAGNATILNNVQTNITKINQQLGQYYQVKWDNANGRYVIDDSKKRAAIAQARKAGSKVGDALDRRFAVMANGRAEANIRAASIPEAMRRWVDSANGSLNNIVDLAPHDPTAPQGNALELRRYYGQGVPMKSMMDGSEGIKPAKELGKMFDTFERNLREIKPEDVDVAPAAGTAAGDYQRNPAYRTYAPTVQSAASKYGVPEQLLSALIQKESSYDPGATGPVIKSGTHKGDRAMGLGQVMGKTAAAYGVTDRASLTPEQQIDLAARILADNKKAGGDWKDAVSRYFTGVDYAKAKSQGRSDGFNNVIQYVESIL